ncbi:MAG TPA: phosphomannomutase, partial [Candidatus Nanoarchaeia archaeon]|nr:phosphomannomutase [Candidatus Nanoarchaeia archaeon]
MIISPYIFRNYDIRGKVGDDLDKEKVESLGKAYGTFLRKRKIKQAVMGWDCRLSGEEFKDAFTRGLIFTGVDVIHLGLVMTQMMYYAQYRFQ